MDQLVSRVTDEVTKRLQTLLSNFNSLAQQAQSPPPPISSQAPAVPLPVEQSTSSQSSGLNISPRTCYHPRYSRGTCCSRWRPVSPSLPVRWAEFAAGNTASQWCFHVCNLTNWCTIATSSWLSPIKLSQMLPKIELIQILHTRLSDNDSFKKRSH